MSSNGKTPPSFDPEKDHYNSWRDDIEVWKMLTDIPKAKIGAAVYLALQGKARELVRTLTTAEIGADDGFEKMIERLDEVYRADSCSVAFTAFSEFYEYRREAGQDFSAFIVEFEKRYHKVKTSDIKELPDGVLAFFLLKAANLPKESEQLARATAKLELKDMREKLMKIFGDPGVLQAAGTAPEVKEEAFYGHGSDRSRGSFRGGHGNGRGDSSWFQSRGDSSGFPGRGRGNWRGGRSAPRCFECGSTGHLVKDCPKRAEQNSVYDQGVTVHLTLLSTKPDEKMKGLLYEALGCGVLDSGCSKTVAGKIWYTEYVSMLAEEEKAELFEKPGSVFFRFGDGVESRSTMLVTVPVRIGRKKLFMDIDIVEHAIPLLISKGAMKQMGMTLDFQRDMALVDGHDVKLVCTPQGITASRYPCLHRLIHIL